MSLIRRSNVFDPFSLDLWDPFESFPFGSGSSSSLFPSFPRISSETAAFASARIDWKETPEAHVFKADVSGLKKEEVKVEIEDGNILQISGERNKEQDGHLAPRGAEQRQVPAQVPTAREHQDGADQGRHGERRAYSHCAQGGRQ